MIDYQPLLERWRGGELRGWAESLPGQLAALFHERRHGDLPRWLAALRALPGAPPARARLDRAAVGIGSGADLPGREARQLERALRALLPWRKGPFEVFGLRIDSEWRSDLKWARLSGAIEPLEGRRVLDVGCGSGYHCWRMRGAGAGEVVGIEPAPLYVCQFWALQRYIRDPAVWVLPLGIEHVPGRLAAFDSVFSMGVLYHRRSPVEHLRQLRGALRPGGELVLESLVIDGGPGDRLAPRGRYAGMRNVRLLPSCATLAAWLRELGFGKVALVDVSATTAAEQRATGWMPFHSLSDFLDPRAPGKTIEGHPAPRRAILTAVKLGH